MNLSTHVYLSSRAFPAEPTIINLTFYRKLFKSENAGAGIKSTNLKGFK